MKTLCRLSAAGFDIESSHTLEELEALTEEERRALVVPIADIFRDKRSVWLNDFFGKLARCGAPIYVRKIGFDGEVGEIVRLYDKDGFFAVGEIRDTEEGKAIKPIRQFFI